jgi:hypothetical protein
MPTALFQTLNGERKNEQHLQKININVGRLLDSADCFVRRRCGAGGDLHR